MRVTQAIGRFQWCNIFFACLMPIMVGLLLSPVVAFAQDPDVMADDDVVADEAPADEAPAAGGSESTAQKTKKKSYLRWAFDSVGIGYSVIFLALSFTLVALFVMNVLAARRENVVPEELIEAFETHLNAKQYQEAYELAKTDETFLGQVLSAGLGKISSGYAPAIEAMQEVGEEENMKMEHKLSYMALIGTLSPMVGLMGTVQGMIAAFQVIATAETAPKPADLAEGISQALFTTLIGLGIAIPALAAYNILRNRVARLVLEVGIVSEKLMGRFQKVGAKKKETP